MEKKIRVFYWPARAGYRTHGGRITQIRRDPMKQMCQKKKKKSKRRENPKRRERKKNTPWRGCSARGGGG